MRRILSTIFAILLTASAFAQSHGNHIMVGVGGSYPQGVEATLAYEHETEYHNAWEYFATAYLKYKKDEEQDMSQATPSGTTITHGLWVQPTSHVLQEAETTTEV